MQSLRRGAAPAMTVLLIAAACGSQQSTNATNNASAPGITANSILLGATYPQSGSAVAYYSVAKGSNAYFQYVNDQGGVNGRKITYKVLDDAYDPSKSLPLVKQLVTEDKVFAIYGNLGTPVNSAIQPYLNEQKVPQVFIFTGATKWGSNYQTYPWTIGWQPSYQVESKIYAKYILQNQPDAKIGILYQNDDYGKDYVKGMHDGLGAKASSMIVDEQTYETKDADVKSQVAALKAKGADTFYIVTIPSYATKAMIDAYQINWHPQIYLNSVSNNLPTMNAVNTATGNSAATANTISVSYLKDVADPKWASDPSMQLYVKVMSKYCSGCDYQHDEFYMSGMGGAFTMVDALKKAGTNLTRQGLLDAAQKLNETDNPAVLPKMIVHTTSTDHFPIAQEQLEKFDGTKWTLFGELINARS